jgi:hypothetical protein
VFPDIRRDGERRARSQVARTRAGCANYGKRGLEAREASSVLLDRNEVNLAERALARVLHILFAYTRLHNVVQPDHCTRYIAISVESPANRCAKR